MWRSLETEIETVYSLFGKISLKKIIIIWSQFEDDIITNLMHILILYYVNFEVRKAVTKYGKQEISMQNIFKLNLAGTIQNE